MTVPEKPSRRASRIVSIAGALVIAIVALIQITPQFISSIKPSTYGDYGLSPDQFWRITDITPGSPAERAGIRVGDYIEVDSLRSRAVMMSSVPPRVGETTAIGVRAGAKRREVVLTAEAARASVPDRISGLLLALTCVAILVVGLWIVVQRPSFMTWGLLLSALGWSWLVGPSPSSIPTHLIFVYNLLWSALLVPAGIIGFMIFYLRFPTDAAMGRWQVLDRASPMILIGAVLFQIPISIGSLPRIHIWELYASAYQHIWDTFLVTICAVCLAAIIGRYRNSDGIEREKTKWVLFGLGCGIVSALCVTLYFENLIGGWLANVLESLVIAAPITLAYATIRYRVIDIRFVASRALVFAAMTIIIGAIVALLDWLFSTKFANSRAQTAVYAGIALAVGFTLNSARRGIGDVVDRLFFSAWHRTKEQAEIVGDEVRRARSTTELYEPLTTRVADAFSLASVALFERMSDGGFVRVAAHGWPAGSLWHILSDDGFARRASLARRPSSLGTNTWSETDFLPGAAAPVALAPVVIGKTVAAILLLGAHIDGTGIDPDELRCIGGLCADASLLFARMPSQPETREGAPFPLQGSSATTSVRLPASF